MANILLNNLLLIILGYLW